MTAKVSVLTAKGGHRLLLTVDGTRLESPPVEHLAFYLGLGGLAAAEIIDWPVAAVLAAGHLLIGLTSRPALEELGQAIDEGL